MMSQVPKTKTKKIKDNETGADKITKKLRLSFRGSKSKKAKEKDKKIDEDDHKLINNVHCGDNGDDIYKNSNDDPDKIILNRKNEENLRISTVSFSETSEEVANAVMEDILASVWKKCDSAMLRNGTVITINPPDPEVRLRKSQDVKSDDKVRKLGNRRASVFDLLDPNAYKRDSIRRDSLYSVEEYDEELDENENKLHNHIEAVNFNITTEQPKKKSFLNKLFRKKSDAKKPSENRNLLLGRKYSSTLELSPSNQGNFERSPSFIKRKLNQLVSSDSPGILKRSFSVRDVDKKKDKPITKEKLTEMKNLEWQKSLQNLRDTDNYVSYDDMSFINYDTLDTLSYTESRNSVNLHRTQSLIVHGSPNSFRPGVARGASVPPHYHSTNDICEQSEALSLPSLHQAIQEHEEIVFETPQPPPRFLRRPYSICSEDGKPRQTRDNGSFRSAGSGCAKLKRTNAYRQKSRDVHTSFHDGSRNGSVRSRSLNHLDTLEMRYGAPSSPDTALKDSRSEPDCTKPLLVPPDPNAEPPPSPTVEVPSSKRHVLSRSQKSSSECFSVNFEVGDESTWDNELFFPASRGVTLHESLLKLCELRSIDLQSCDAWLQDKDSNTNTLLHFTQDTANLVGRHIRITGKEFGSKRSSLNQSKKYIGSTRQKTSSIFSSSTEDPTYSNWPHDARLSFQDADTSKKQSKQRWSGLFGNNKDTKMEALAEHLNNYTKHGVPTPNIYPQGQCDSLDALYKLEGDWREIIDYKDLTERQQQQQTAVWELIKTEVAYIKTLKVVTELFLACLKNLQSVNLLKEIDTEKLFSNITEILDTNVQFWRNSLFPLVKNMRQYKQPPCIETMAHGFLNMKDTFRAYFQYCAEQARCQHYCRENHAHNELFTAYLAWCETQKECNRLRLMDILVQPMQRLTKYGLLLKAILKNTDEEVERDTLNLMIRSVDDFVNKVNSSLRQRQDTERLRGLIIRIESYDVVESKDDDLERLLKTYSPLDLTKPMIGCSLDRKRHLLLEGDLKLKDSSTSKMEVHCFLLTDMLLVCKPSTKKGGATMRVIRQPYLVDRLVVHELNRETPSLALIYKNEFDMAVAGFILQNNDHKKLKSWKDGIAKAQQLYDQAKQQTYFEESLDPDYSFADVLEGDYHSVQLAPRSPLASSSRASRVSSLAHSHSGSVEMNDQSSIGSGKEHSRAVSVENENRTASISSDEGVQPLPPDKTSVSQKNSFKQRLLNKTPNTLTVQPYTNLGQSLPNLSLGSANIGSLSLTLNQNTLSVPNTKNGSHLLSPTHRGISYPPPSPTRANLRRGLAISQSKNPPLLKTRHVNSTASVSSGQVPTSFDFDVPVIAGVLPGEQCENFSRGQLRQAMVKRSHRNDNKRYHTAGTVDDIKKNDNRDASIHKRLSWNYGSQEPPPTQEDET